MNIKHNDIVIDLNKPFKNDALKREKYAKILSGIVSTYADGFVLAINNEWGTGKTTFVKMWQQQLNIDGFQTLYFNAWENDFERNPLVALMGELKSLVKSDSKEFKSLLKKGAVITKNILPHLLKAIASKYIDTEILVNAIEDASKSATEILSDEIKEYSEKKDGMKEFRESLSKLIETTKGNKPVVFIIDELDRCRPSYAVELLEQVKHFFSVAGIVFVLSIDKTQLGYAIKGAYGNDKINTDEYLRRFIDIEYSIPDPDTKAFCKYLSKYFDFESFFHSERRRRDFKDVWNDLELLITFSSALFEKAKVTLRQQEKIFAHIRLGLNLSDANEYIFPSLYLMLIFIKTFHEEFYLNMKLKKLKLEDLGKELLKIMPTGIQDDESKYFIEIEALMVCMYNNYYYNTNSRNLIKKDSKTNELNSIIGSAIDNSKNNDVFIEFINMFNNHHNYNFTKIDHLFKKIDLIAEVIT